MDTIDSAHPARRLGGALEPVIGAVYFSPECHAAYARLGFADSPGAIKGVASPDGPAYFTSRGSLLGEVPGEVVAAAFAVFNPAVVIPSVGHGWSLTDAATICAARDAGALAQLERLLGPDPDRLDAVVIALRRACEAVSIEGRPLTAGLVALPEPDHPLGALFRLGDRLREFRGDSHTAAWISAGLDPIEIGLLTELYWGLPLRSYTQTRGWSDTDFDGAEDRLRTRGLIGNAGFTSKGREIREQIEVVTDAQMRRPLEAIGDSFDDLINTLSGWGAKMRDGYGYPVSGPHDLADAASGRA